MLKMEQEALCKTKNLTHEDMILLLPEDLRIYTSFFVRPLQIDKETDELLKDDLFNNLSYFNQLLMMVEDDPFEDDPFEYNVPIKYRKIAEKMQLNVNKLMNRIEEIYIKLGKKFNEDGELYYDICELSHQDTRNFGLVEKYDDEKSYKSFRKDFFMEEINDMDEKYLPNIVRKIDDIEIKIFGYALQGNPCCPAPHPVWI
jgi:hypothetical protein